MKLLLDAGYTNEWSTYTDTGIYISLWFLVGGQPILTVEYNDDDVEIFHHTYLTPQSLDKWLKNQASSAKE